MNYSETRHREFPPEFLKLIHHEETAILRSFFVLLKNKLIEYIMRNYKSEQYLVQRGIKMRLKKLSVKGFSVVTAVALLASSMDSGYVFASNMENILSGDSNTAEPETPDSQPVETPTPTPTPTVVPTEDPEISGDPSDGTTPTITPIGDDMTPTPVISDNDPSEGADATPTPVFTTYTVRVFYQGPVEVNGSIYYDYSDEYVIECITDENGTITLPDIPENEGMTFAGFVAEDDSEVTEGTVFNSNTNVYAVYDYAAVTLDENEEVIVKVWYKGPVTVSSSTFYDYTEQYVIECIVKEDGTIDYPSADTCNYPGYELSGFKLSDGTAIDPAYVYSENTDIYATYKSITTADYTWNIGNPTSTDVKAELYVSTGKLVISGTGDTTVYSSFSSVPWYNYRTKITSVEFEDTVTPTNLDYWFYGTKVTTMDWLPEGVTSYKYTFDACQCLCDVYVPSNAVVDWIFYGATMNNLEIDLESVTMSSNSVIKNSKINGSLNLIGSVDAITPGFISETSSIGYINASEENVDALYNYDWGTQSSKTVTGITSYISDTYVNYTVDTPYTVHASATSNFNMPRFTYQWYQYDSSQSKYIPIEGEQDEYFTFTASDDETYPLKFECLVSDGISSTYTRVCSIDIISADYNSPILKNAALITTNTYSVVSRGKEGDVYQGEALVFLPGMYYVSSTDDTYVRTERIDNGDIIYFEKQDDFDLLIDITMKNEDDDESLFHFFVNPTYVISSADFTAGTITICGINAGLYEFCTGSMYDALPEEYTIGETYHGLSVSGSLNSNVRLQGVKRFIIDNPQISGTFWISGTGVNTNDLEYLDISNTTITDGYFGTILDRCPNLREVYLPSTLKSGYYITDCPNIEVLDLEPYTGSSTGYTPILTDSMTNEETKVDLFIPAGYTYLEYMIYTGAGYNSAIRSITGCSDITTLALLLDSNGKGGMFYGRHIELVDLSQSQITTIKAGTFNNCIIDKLILPSTLTTIESSAFTNCEIGELIISDDAAISTLSGGTFSGAKIGSFKLPSSIKVIKTGAFYNTEIGTLILHNGLENVEQTFINGGHIKRLLRDNSTSGETQIQFTNTCNNMDGIEIVEFPFNTVSITNCFNTSHIKNIAFVPGMNVYNCFNYALISGPISLDGNGTAVITPSFNNSNLNGLTIKNYTSCSITSATTVTNNVDISNITSLQVFAGGGTIGRNLALSDIETIASGSLYNAIIGGNVTLNNIGTITSGVLCSAKISGNLSMDTVSSMSSAVNGCTTEGNVSLYNLPTIANCFQGFTCKGNLLIDGIGDISGSAFSSNGGYSRGSLTIKNAGNISSSSFNGVNYTGNIVFDDVDAINTCAFTGNTCSGTITFNNVDTINSSAVCGNVYNGKLTISNIGSITSGAFCSNKASEISISSIENIDGALCANTSTGKLTVSDIESVTSNGLGPNIASEVIISDIGNISSAMNGIKSTGSITLIEVDQVVNGLRNITCTTLNITNSGVFESGAFDGATISESINFDSVDEVGADSFNNIHSCTAAYLTDVETIGERAFYGMTELVDIHVSGNTTAIGVDAFGIAAPKLVRTSLMLESPYAASVFFTAEEDEFSWQTLNRIYDRLLSNPSDTNVKKDETAVFESHAAIGGGQWQWYTAKPLSPDEVHYTMDTASAAYGIMTYSEDPYLTEDGDSYVLDIPASTNETLYYSIFLTDTDKIAGDITLNIGGGYFDQDMADSLVLRINGTEISSSGPYTYQISTVSPIKVEVIAIDTVEDVQIRFSIGDVTAYALSTIEGATDAEYTIRRASLDQDNTLYCCSYGTDTMDNLDISRPYYIEFSLPAVLMVSEAIPDTGNNVQTGTDPSVKTTSDNEKTEPVVVMTPLPEDTQSTQSEADKASSDRGTAADTGDHNNPVLYILMIVFCVAGITVWYKKKKQ